MRLLGYLIMAIAGLVWIFGGRALLRSHLRRLGREPLLFDSPVSLFGAELNAQERTKRNWLFLAVLATSFLGSAFANGAFG